MTGTPFIISLASAGLAVFLFFLVLYVFALIRRDNSVVDIGWPIAFILAVMVVLWQREVLNLRHAIVTSLVSVWAVRLSLHVWLRNRGKGEDWWHKAWRKSWGEHWVIRSFLQLYVLQAGYVMLIVLPALYVSTYSGRGLGVLDFIGLGVWVLGFFIEAIGDHQLVTFKRKSKNKGHVLQSGLWRYSRHPNYFGEVLMWVGIWLIALSVSGSVFTIISPLFVLLLLLWLRGIPSIEKHLSVNPEYLAYQKNTSTFVPWFPNKS